jgi:MoxR-like ATPase
MLSARAYALLDGRLTPSIDDIALLARPVLQHRMALNFAAHADEVSLTAIIDRLIESSL